mgnify:CR=1 FL=1
MGITGTVVNDKLCKCSCKRWCIQILWKLSYYCCFCGSGYCNPCNNGILCNCQNALELANLTHSIFLLGMMIPIYALVIPLFSIFKGMGLLDTHLAVIIPQIAVGFPMAIFIICGFMRSIPTELGRGSNY